MPQTAQTFEGYKTDIRSRSAEDRSNAVDRHLELLTNSSTSIQSAFLSRMKDLKKRGRNSQSYEQILATLEILDNFMDEVVTEEMKDFVRNGLMDTYAALLQQCDEYLQSHSGRRYTQVGKDRVQAVEDLRKAVDDEAQLMAERLESVSSFGRGITLRQLFAGMRPLEAVDTQASDFSLPELQSTQAVILPNDPILGLHALRETLRDDETVDSNDRAILDILLEQIDRAYLRGETTLCADLLDRVVALCGDAEADSTLDKLSKACTNFKVNKGLESSAENAAYSSGTTLHDVAYQGDDLADNAFPEYRHLNPAVARYLAQKTPFNKGDNNKGDNKASKLLYGMDEAGNTSKFGGDHGYIQTDNSLNINEYLRKLSNGEDLTNTKTHHDFASLRTIALLDQASKSSSLPEKTRLHRMLSSLYLTYNFGIAGANGQQIPAGTVRTINQQAGKIITESNFMCTGFNMDAMFGTHPVMLTLLCDEGTPVFSTRNLAEGEIILGRGTQYMILGAIAHTAANALNIPTSHLQINNQYAEGQEGSGDFKGIEIFAKVLSAAPAAENKSQSKAAFESFQARQKEYKPNFSGDHGDWVHRKAYLAMSNADLKSLSPQEAAAMDEYTHDSGDINRRLRSGEVNHDVTDAQNFFIKQAFAKHPIPVAMETYRGVSDGFLTFLLDTTNFSEEDKQAARTAAGGIDHTWLEKDEHFKIFEGITFQDKAFVSTSTNKAFARRWANMVRHDEQTRANGGTVNMNDMKRTEDIAGAHVLNMHLPAGTRAMFADAMYTRNQNIPRGQDEVTLDAGYTYTIERVVRVGHGIYEMDVRCMG